MMRRQYIRKHSLAARVAYPTALFSCVLGIVATIAHRSALLYTNNFLLVAILIFLLALTGFILSIFGLYAVWSHGAKGAMRSTYALGLSLPALLIGLAAVVMATLTAPLSDISTDTLDPPHFTTTDLSYSGSNINEPPRTNRQIQSKYYPNLIGRRYVLPTETILAHVVRQISDQGWQSAYEKSRFLGNGDWIVEATATTPLFGFIDQIVVRVTDEGGATYIDMRSAALYGQYDLGGNARRIETFLTNLDKRVSQQAH